MLSCCQCQPYGHDTAAALAFLQVQRALHRLLSREAVAFDRLGMHDVINEVMPSQTHNAEAAELTHGLKAVVLLSLSRSAYDASAILWPSVTILAIAKIASIRAIVSIR